MNVPNFMFAANILLSRVLHVKRRMKIFHLLAKLYLKIIPELS
jgi:hypothetical protein